MKRFQTLFLLLAVLFVAVPVCHAQGLAERRAIKEYQDKIYPDLKKQIDTAAGFEVKTTVAWDKLTIAEQSEHYLDKTYFTNILFMPLVRALQSITKDDMGKTALKEKLKEIVITFDSAKIDSDGHIKFDAGVLTINYEPWVNSSEDESDSYFKERVSDITKTLESKL